MQKLDTSRTYETPEGIDLELRIAGPIVRALAWLIDALIRAVAYFGLSLTLAALGGVGWAGIMIGTFLIEWFYPVIFEVYRGATPGKKSMGLEVIQDNGTPVNWTSSLVRNLLRVVDFLPFLYGLGLLSILMNKDFKRLGDIAAGTLVVYRDPGLARNEIPAADPKPPPVDLLIAEQRTLLDLAERSSLLSAERLIELAEMLEELTGKRGQEAVDEVFAYANWLARGR